jgi:predicted ATPase
MDRSRQEVEFGGILAKKIGQDMSELKTPIRGDQVFLETLSGNIDVNASLQGSGFQSAATIVSAVVFSPDGSTVIIEEPEAFLHPGSQEAIVDMINEAVKRARSRKRHGATIQNKNG